MSQLLELARRSGWEQFDVDFIHSTYFTREVVFLLFALRLVYIMYRCWYISSIPCQKILAERALLLPPNSTL
jgi:hypothetical protein